VFGVHQQEQNTLNRLSGHWGLLLNMRNEFLWYAGFVGLIFFTGIYFGPSFETKADEVVGDRKTQGSKRHSEYAEHTKDLIKSKLVSIKNAETSDFLSAKQWIPQLSLQSEANNLHNDAAYEPQFKMAVENIVEQMNTQQLRSAITSLTNITSSELDQVDNLQLYANRLADIAMDAIVSEPAPLVSGVNTVNFSTFFSPDTGAVNVASNFPADTNSIFASFPTSDYPGNKVIVKWSRTDDPNMLLFKRRTIVENMQENYVWLQMTYGWPAGQYRVQIYSADQNVALLAQGDYSIE